MSVLFTVRSPVTKTVQGIIVSAGETFVVHIMKVGTGLVGVENI